MEGFNIELDDPFGLNKKKKPRTKKLMQPRVRRIETIYYEPRQPQIRMPKRPRVRADQPPSLMELATSPQAKETYAMVRLGAKKSYGLAKKGIGALKANLRKRRGGSIYGKGQAYGKR